MASPGVSQTRARDAEGAARPRFHALFATGSPKQVASSWFCSRTVQAPANPKPLRSHSMASKPWIVRRAVVNDRNLGSFAGEGEILR